MHIAKSDTFQLGIGWLSEKNYGEGGFFIMIGYRYINFWKRVYPTFIRSNSNAIAEK